MTDLQGIVSEIKTVELADGNRIPLPRMTNKKVIKLALMLTGDISGLYEKVRDGVRRPLFYKKGVQKKDESGQPLTDESGNPVLYNGTEPVLNSKGEAETVFDSSNIQGIVTEVISGLDDGTLTKLLATILDRSEPEVEAMDVFDTVLIVAEFLDNTNVEKAFLAIKKVASKFQKKPKQEGTSTQEVTSNSTSNVLPIQQTNM